MSRGRSRAAVGGAAPAETDPAESEDAPAACDVEISAHMLMPSLSESVPKRSSARARCSAGALALSATCLKLSSDCPISPSASHAIARLSRATGFVGSAATATAKPSAARADSPALPCCAAVLKISSMLSCRGSAQPLAYSGWSGGSGAAAASAPAPAPAAPAPAAALRALR